MLKRSSQGLVGFLLESSCSFSILLRRLISKYCLLRLYTVVVVNFFQSLDLCPSDISEIKLKMMNKSLTIIILPKYPQNYKEGKRYEWSKDQEGQVKCQFYFFIQLINKRRLLMKTSSQKIPQKKKIKRQFIERFKTEVRDSNSIENLRISKIDESSYKIYNTHHKNAANHNTTTKHAKTNAAFFSHKPHSQMNQLQTERKVRLGASSDYFLKQCQNQQIQKDNGWSTKSKYLEQVLKRRLEDFYQLIKTKVGQVQNLCVLREQKKNEVHRLQELNNIISIVDSIYKSTTKLKSLCGFDLQAHNINIILKSLIDKAENYDKSNQTHPKFFPWHCDRIRTETDEAVHALGQQMLSVSSFKIQNQKTHQQQFLNAYLSNHNSKVDLHYNKAEQYIRQETGETNEQGRFSKCQNLTNQYNTQTITTNQLKSDSRKISVKSFKSLPRSPPIQSQPQVVCQLLRCDQIQKQSQNTDSQSKRRVLNEVIVMLNSKYNRCIKLQ